ncbi:DinB family protein [Gracilimonas sp.]|uniref:DinB family protein n=1 Tax=Gracilimonas sp. TaxID=1974203 RepID=UPI0028720373|nr:DinB family protein [Gracilimonas sp.]
MDLAQLIEYDQWANTKIFKASISPNQQIRDPKIHKLLSHLLAAQNIWINRITGDPLPNKIWPDLPVSEIEQMLNENPEKLKGLITREDEVVNYRNSKGKEFSNIVEEILFHLTIHGQHHRAQIAQLLRAQGVTPPATDFIFFLRALDN